MIFSMLFLFFTLKDPSFPEYLTNLAEIVGPPVVYGVPFSNSKDPWSFVGPGRHQVSSGVLVRIVEEMLRVKATDIHWGYRNQLYSVYKGAVPLT